MSADSEQIRNLLGRYYHAETTLEEERHLRSLLGGALPDEDLAPDAAVLGAHDMYRDIGPGPDFEHRLLEQIRRDKPVYRLRELAVAATLALLIGAAWWMWPAGPGVQPAQSLMADTFESPDEALQELEAALELISTHFAQGLGMTFESMEPIEELDILIQ